MKLDTKHPLTVAIIAAIITALVAVPSTLIIQELLKPEKVENIYSLRKELVLKQFIYLATLRQFCKMNIDFIVLRVVTVQNYINVYEGNEKKLIGIDSVENDYIIPKFLTDRNTFESWIKDYDGVNENLDKIDVEFVDNFKLVKSFIEKHNLLAKRRSSDSTNFVTDDDKKLWSDIYLRGKWMTLNNQCIDLINRKLNLEE